MEPSLEIARRIVGRHDPSRRVDRLERLPGSAHGRVFALHGADGAPPLVLKCFGAGEAWRSEQEALVFELLRGAGVPVPDVLARAPDWILTSWLPGRLVAALERSGGDRRAVYRTLGATLRAIHSVARERFGFFDRHGTVSGLATNADFARAWFARDLARFREAGGSPELAARIEARVAAAGPLLAACAAPVLCHNDLHEANVLVERAADGWRVTGVLDAGGAVAADPLFDLARTDYWAARGDAEKRAGLREGYGLAPDPDAEARVALWTLHHALELWSWFARAPGGASVRDAIAADLEALAGAD